MIIPQKVCHCNRFKKKSKLKIAYRNVCKFGFEQWGLHRIEAGAYSAAIGSWKALEKNGFKREAIFRKQAISGDKYMDVYRYGLLETELIGNK